MRVLEKQKASDEPQEQREECPKQPFAEGHPIAVGSLSLHIDGSFWFELALKAIAEAKAGDDVLAIATYLFAQASNVDIDRAIQHIHLVIPHAREDLFSREHIAPMLQEQFQNLKLLFGQCHFFAIHRGLDAARVHLQRLVGEEFFLLLLLDRIRAPQHGFYTGSYLFDREWFRYIVVRT